MRVHRDGTHPWEVSASMPGDAFVGGASPNGQRAMIWPEMTVHEIEDVCIVGPRQRVVEVASDPSTINNVLVWRDAVTIVIGVQKPGKTHLPKVSGTDH